MPTRTIKGSFFRSDLTEYISEAFAKKYTVSLDSWIQPFAYYDEGLGVILCNSRLEDGLYVTLGKVIYPSSIARDSYHIVFQYNLARCRGMELRWADRFKPYPNLPKHIPLSPTFPMLKVGSLVDYREAKEIYYKIKGKPFTIDELKGIIDSAELNTVESRLYRLRLALQREIDKEK